MNLMATSAFYIHDGKSLPEKKRFPEADVVVLKEAVEHTLHHDGRTETNVRRAWMYLTEFGRDKFSDVPVSFNADRRTFTLHQAATFMKDGTLFETPHYGVNKVVPFALDRAPDLCSIRDAVVSLLGTEVGAVSVIEYTIVDSAPWKEFFWGEQNIGGQFPVLEKTIAINVPAGSKLAFSARNWDEKPQITHDGRFDRYVWSAQDIPAYDPEDGQPGFDRWVPVIAYSTAGDWENVSSLLKERFASAFRSHPSIVNAAREKTTGAGDPSTTAARIHKFVFEGIRTIDLPPSSVDFALRDAQRIFDSGYGYPLEKSLALAVMAEACGLKARVFMGAHSYKASPQFVFPGDDVQAWVEIEAGNRLLFVRPDKALHEANQAHLEEMILAPVSFDGPPFTPEISRPAGEADITAKLTLKEDLSLEGRVTCGFAGALNPFFRVASDDKTTLDTIAGELAGKLFKDAKADKVAALLLSPEQTSFNFELKGARAERAAAGFVSVDWPDLSVSIPGVLPPLFRENRKTMLVLPASASLSLEMEISKPRDCTARILPNGSDLAANAAGVTASCEEKEGKLIIKARWRFPRKLVHPKDYAGFRSGLAKAAGPESRSVLLEGI